MDETTVKKCMQLFKDDVKVLINMKRCLGQLYYGTVDEIPECIEDMLVVSTCFDTDGDEPLVALLVEFKNKESDRV